MANIFKGTGIIKRTCSYCGKEFETYKWRGKGTYCSKECADKDKVIEHSPNTKCFICEKPIYIKPSRIRRSKTGKFTCSKECMGKMRSKVFIGDNNGNYGNKVSTKIHKGYCYIRSDNHPFKDYQGFIRKHRYVIEQNYSLFESKYFIVINGSHYLKPEIDVHHKDGDTLNNNIDNLIPISRSEHTSTHNKEKVIIRDNKGRITEVFKLGELLENHSNNDNQQPSDNSNIIEGSTTSSRIQTDNAEDSNAATSAQPKLSSNDIV